MNKKKCRRRYFCPCSVHY